MKKINQHITNKVTHTNIFFMEEFFLLKKILQKKDISKHE